MQFNSKVFLEPWPELPGFILQPQLKVYVCPIPVQGNTQRCARSVPVIITMVIMYCIIDGLHKQGYYICLCYDSGKHLNWSVMPWLVSTHATCSINGSITSSCSIVWGRTEGGHSCIQQTSTPLDTVVWSWLALMSRFVGCWCVSAHGLTLVVYQITL
jgi:hypothetical protein